MKRFKLRFSYFLILGIVGFILQFVSSISWGNASSTISTLVSKSGSGEFVKYLVPSIIMAISTLFVGVLYFGYLRASKKDQFYVKVGSISGLASQALVLIASIVYIIVASVCRTDLNSSKNVLTATNVFVTIRNMGIMFSLASFFLIYLGVKTTTKKDKSGNFGLMVGLILNGIAFLAIFVTLMSSIFTDANELFVKYVEETKSVSVPYELTMYSMNGFTFAHCSRLVVLLEEIATDTKGLDLSALKLSTIFALVGSLSYMVSCVGNFLASSFLMIESFDVDKDDEPMSL